MQSKGKKGISLLEMAIALSVFFLIFGVGVAFIVQVEKTFENQVERAKQEERIFLLFDHIARELEKSSFEKIKVKENGREITYKVFFDWEEEERDFGRDRDGFDEDRDDDLDDDLDRDQDGFDEDRDDDLDDDSDRDEEDGEKDHEEKRKIWWDPQKKAVFWKRKKGKKVLLEEGIVEFRAKKESSKSKKCIQVICKKKIGDQVVLFSRIFAVPFRHGEERSDSH